MIEMYVDIVEQLVGYLRKVTGISDISLFEDKGIGIRGIVTLSSIEKEGPDDFGRVVTLSLRLVDSFSNWQRLFEKMGVIDDELSCSHVDKEQTITTHTYTGGWRLVDDPSVLIYETDLMLRVVRNKEYQRGK